MVKPDLVETLLRILRTNTTYEQAAPYVRAYLDGLDPVQAAFATATICCEPGGRGTDITLADADKLYTCLSILLEVE